jgi:hypothetical protein
VGDRRGPFTGGRSTALRITPQWRLRSGRHKGPQAPRACPPPAPAPSPANAFADRLGARRRASRHGDQRWRGHGRTAEVPHSWSAWTGWPSPAKRTGHGNARRRPPTPPREARRLSEVRRSTVRSGCWPFSPRSRSFGQRCDGAAVELACEREPSPRRLRADALGLTRARRRHRRRAAGCSGFAGPEAPLPYVSPGASGRMVPREGSSWRPQGGVVLPVRNMTPMLRPGHTLST